jgi:hypothetical protein
VAGINQYVYAHSLRGAVNDAEDVADALTHAGAEVRVLRDQEVTTGRLRLEWQRMLKEAHAGSLLVFYYAGHSADAREQTADAHGERYEYLVFSGFHTNNRADPSREPDQSLTGHELRKWFQEAARFRLLTVFDSCTSGHLYRSSQAPAMGAHRTAFDDAADALPAVAGKSPQDDGPAVLRNQVFIAGAPPRMTVDDLLIGDRYRGALSYYFAQALRGAAPHTGMSLTITDLDDYLTTSVLRRTDDAQRIYYLKGHDLDADEPLLEPPPGAAAAAAAATPDLPAIPVAVGTGTSRSILERLEGVIPADSGKPALLLLDLASRRVVNERGEVVAEPATDDVTTVQHVINKWRHIVALSALADRRSQSIHLTVGRPEETHGVPWLYKGQRVGIVVTGLTGERQVTLFDLTSTGTVELLYPVPKESHAPDAEGTLYVSADAGSPFGADHVIAVSSEDSRDMRLFTDYLRNQFVHSGSDALTSDGELLQRVARLHGLRVGIQSLYTCVSEERCGK